MLLRIVAPHFVAGYDVTNDRIAPIIRYMRRWSLAKIFAYCMRKGWELQVMP